MKLRVLSWNVHGLPSPFSRRRAQRLPRIAARIEAERPDLVAIQEAWAGSPRLLLPHLPSYAARCVRTRGGGAAGGLLLLLREGGDFVAVEESLRFRRYSHSGPRRRVWEADGLAGKGAAFLRLAHRDGHAGLWFVNTHLQSRYGANGYVEVRRSQIHELLRWVGELGLAAPVVVAGDFNTPAVEDGLYDAVAALGVDVTEEERRRSGAFTNYPNHSTAAWIDYVLVRPPAGAGARGRTRLIMNAAADDPFSDHSALVVDVEVEEIGDGLHGRPANGVESGGHDAEGPRS